MMNLNSILLEGTVASVNPERKLLQIKHVSTPFHFVVNYEAIKFVPAVKQSYRIVGSLGFYMPTEGYPELEVCIDAQFIEPTIH